MFNIRNLVSRISQAKDGETSETSSNKSRTVSQASSVFADEGVPVEAEGFLCPTCMAAFPSPDSLQSHYEKEHLEPGANYLCPVCKARLDNATDLELHYSNHHSTTRASTGDLDVLMQEINTLTSSLNEERQSKWNSEELRKEVSQLKEMIKAQGSGEEHQMYQQQLQGLSETKSLLTSEVVLLRKQLAEALETTLNLKQGREKLEEKAARNSQTVADLQASLDENTGLIAALRENIKDLESQLTHKSSVDDSEVLKKELASIQRLMDESATVKEKELDELREKLSGLQIENETLKNEHKSSNQEVEALEPTPDGDLLERVKLLELDKLRLENELENKKTEIEEVKRFFTEKNDQLVTLQHMREETDVCVVQLRQEVTSLQDMLNQARHQAEGQVSAKEDELMRFKLDLSKHQQQVDQLEAQCRSIQKSHDQLTTSLAQKERELEERNQSLKLITGKVTQLEEKIVRLEQERSELMVTIEKGEGFDTAIQQLQQDNSRLQEELAGLKANITLMENQNRVTADERAAEENRLKEEIVGAQNIISNLSKDLEIAQNKQSQLEKSSDDARTEIGVWRSKCQETESKIQEVEKLSLSRMTQLEEKNNELTQLQTDLETVRQGLAQKENDNNQLEKKLQKVESHAENLARTIKDLEIEVSRSKSTHQEDAKQLDQLKSQLTDKLSAMQRLEERVAELEPLTEAIEHEKLRRIKEKAEWGEHEQLLRGEKESLATLTTHLQQQLDEQATEHRIHLQRLKTEADTLLKDKNQLSEQLNAVKDGRSKDNSVWQEKHVKLEEVLKTLTSNLTAAEDLSATRYQRCEELQASAEKYHALKIELEARLALFEEEKVELQNNCSQWENEVDRLKFNAAELRRRLEDSQAALHELGRENQSLQMENAKLQGRKWADDSEVVDCHTCQKSFNLTVRKHHCRNCGQIFCNECSSKSTAVGNSRKPVRVCDSCFKELTINSPR